MFSQDIIIVTVRKVPQGWNSSDLFCLVIYSKFTFNSFVKIRWSLSDLKSFQWPYFLSPVCLKIYITDLISFTNLSVLLRAKMLHFVSVLINTAYPIQSLFLLPCEILRISLPSWKSPPRYAGEGWRRDMKNVRTVVGVKICKSVHCF